MKKEEKLSFDNLLTWEDVFQLGYTTGDHILFTSKKYLVHCLTDVGKLDLFNENFYNEVIKPMDLEFPKSKLSVCNPNEIRFVYTKNEEGKTVIKYSLPHFLVMLLITADCSHDERYFRILLKTYLKSSKEEMIEHARNFLRDQKEVINNKIREYDNNALTFKNNIFKDSDIILPGLNELVKSSKSYSKEDLFEVRTVIVDRLKNLDRFVQYCDKEFPIEAFKYVSKDRYLLMVISILCSDPAIIKYYNDEIDFNELIKSYPEKDLVNFFNLFNNYLLLCEYISDENNEDYYYKFKCNLDDNKQTFDSEKTRQYAFSIISKLFDESPIFKNDDYFESYEEFLIKKTNDTWNRIQNNKLLDSIKLNFELISSGSKIKLDKSSVLPESFRKPKTEKSKAKLKKDYDLLDKKIDYYGKLEPKFSFLGINNFVGYFAQLFDNGVVVLDRYYKITKTRFGDDKVVPASGDAIYTMNYKEFATLSRYSKPELIEEIGYKNPDVNRIYHSGEWTERVDSVITGKGYGEIDLDFLKSLSESISFQDKQKILEKK